MGIKDLKKSITQTCEHLKDMSETYAKASSAHDKSTAQLLQKLLHEKIKQQTSAACESAMYEIGSSVLEYIIVQNPNKGRNLEKDCKKIDQAISEQENTSEYNQVLISYVDILNSDELATLYKIMRNKSLMESFSFIRSRASRLGLTV